MSCAFFIQEPFVCVALDVGVERDPLLAVDEIGDEASQLGRILDLVLRLPEDEAEHPPFLAQSLKRSAILHLERVAFLGQEGGPIEAAGDDGCLRPRRLRALVGHLEEEKERQLLDVVAVGEAVVAKDVAVVPEFGDDLLGGHSASVHFG